MAIDYTKEIKKDKQIRDVRSTKMKFKDSFTSRGYSFFWTTLFTGSAFILPMGGELALAASAFAMRYAIKRQNNLPMPASKPKSSGLKGADGVTYMGNDRRTGKELNLSNRQNTTHSYYLGTTGAGKTEFLLSYSLNFLIQGSSFSMIDGKGSAGLFHAVSSLARYYSREEDLLLVNFLSGPKDIMGAQRSKISNEFNALNRLSATAISQLLIAVSSTGNGGGDVWEQRKQSFIENICPPLVFLRDNYKFQLDANTMRGFFTLSAIEELLLLKPFMYDGLLPYLQGLAMYIENIPGWGLTKSVHYKKFIEEMMKPNNARTRRDFEKLYPNIIKQANEHLVNGIPDGAPPEIGGGQTQETDQQQGFITMQLTRLFGSLADVYGYIMRSLNSEIDTTDVVLHRRIWITLLPALSKSLAEVKNLGNFSLSSIRQAMSIGLGYEVEGTKEEIIDSAATNAPAPKAIIADECNAYVIDGTFVIPAQARSLGIAMTFAGQDIAGLERAVEKEAGSILGNTPTKFCGKIDDEKVGEYLDKQFGEAKFAVNSAYDNLAEQGSGSTILVESDKISIESIKRISFEELKKQTVGHWHYFYGLDIYHIESFYANTKLTPVLRVPHFLSVKSFNSIEGRAVNNSLKVINDIMQADLHKDDCLSKAMNEYLSLTKSNRNTSVGTRLLGFEMALLQINRFNDEEGFLRVNEEEWLPLTPFSPPYSMDRSVLRESVHKANQQHQVRISLSDEGDLNYLRNDEDKNLLRDEMKLLISASLLNNAMENILTSPIKTSLERVTASAKALAAYTGSGMYMQNNAQLAAFLGEEETDKTIEAMSELNKQTLSDIANDYSKAHKGDDKYEVSELASLLDSIVNTNQNIFKGDFKISAWQQ